MNQEQIEQLVFAFYRAWLTWVTDGAPRDILFHRGIGLCGCLADFMENHSKMSGKRITYDDGVKAKKFMKNHFQAKGLDKTYPFGLIDFDRRANNDTMHLCEERVNFVKEMLK